LDSGVAVFRAEGARRTDVVHRLEQELIRLEEQESIEFAGQE
jgi:hypothetical protein